MRVCVAGLCVWSRWFVYMYVYVLKPDVQGLTARKSSNSVIYCLLVDDTTPTTYLLRLTTTYLLSLLRQAMCLEKKVWKHSINRAGEGFP